MRRLKVIAVPGSPRNLCVVAEVEGGERIACMFEICTDIWPKGELELALLKGAFLCSLGASRARATP